MKKIRLPLIFLAIIAILGYAYLYWQKQQTTNTAENSYIACIQIEGSVIQESYPPVCVTKSGQRFIELLPPPPANFGQVPVSSMEPQPVSTGPMPLTHIYHGTDTKVSSYTSTKAKLSFTFPQPLYVSDSYNDYGNGTGSGEITIANEQIDNNFPPSINITYGIPTIDGKGGMCVDANGNAAWQTKTFLGQVLTSVCDVDLSLSIGYPQYPGGGIEYSFNVGGQNITESEAQIYKNIVYSAKFVK